MDPLMDSNKERRSMKTRFFTCCVLLSLLGGIAPGAEETLPPQMTMAENGDSLSVRERKDELVNHLEALEGKMAALEKQRKQSEGKQRRIEEDKETLERRKQAIEVEKKKINAQLANLRSRLGGKNDELARYRGDKIRQIKAAIEQVERQLKSARVNRKDILDKISQNDSWISDGDYLDVRLASARERLRKAKEDLEKAFGFEWMHPELVKARDSAESDVKSLESEINRKSSNISNARRENDQLKPRLRRIESEIADIELKQSKLEEELRSLEQGNNGEDNAVITKLKREMSQIEAEISRLEASLPNLDNESLNISKNITDKMQEGAKLAAAISEVNKDIVELSGNIDNLQNQISSLNGEIFWGYVWWLFLILCILLLIALLGKLLVCRKRL